MVDWAAPEPASTNTSSADNAAVRRGRIILASCEVSDRMILEYHRANSVWTSLSENLRLWQLRMSMPAP